MLMRSYAEFLAAKRIADPMTGIASPPDDFGAALMLHQDAIARWALRRGRAAVFAGTGLGKTRIELVWGREVAAATTRPVLCLAPLAVGDQHAAEAARIGVDARQVERQDDVGPGVNITNYQKLDRFDLSAFGGIILDESSILKAHDGHYRTRLIEGAARIPFRLAATATPAPNDFMELGNHAEFLGVMSYTDMLATFFVHDASDTRVWRLKGHAERAFWDWMASWAVMLEKPSDLGFPDDGYDLPPLVKIAHEVAVSGEDAFDPLGLAPIVADRLGDRLKARRDSVDARVAVTKEIVMSALWLKLAECHGNLNTPRTAESAAPPIPNIEPNEIDRPATLKNAAPISMSGGSKTPTRCAEAENSRTRSTNGVASATPMTTPTARRQSNPPETAIRNADGTPGCEPSSASDRPNTMPSLPGRVEDAPSAGAQNHQDGASDSPSITATAAAKSGESCAQAAIKALASLQTMPTVSAAPPTMSKVAEPWVIWCHLNSEQSALECAFGTLAISIHGGLSDKEKSERHHAWLRGERPILIVKPSMFGYGLNWQHCANCVFVGLSDSFEQVYQAIRRFWRFGQTRAVTAHFVHAASEGAVIANLDRKERDAARMMAAMIAATGDISSAAVRGVTRDRPDYAPELPMMLPSWPEFAR